MPFLLLEASDGVGGRVRTDVVDGFQLDRGFQIFLTSYPECKVDGASPRPRRLILCMTYGVCIPFHCNAVSPAYTSS